MAVAVTTGSGDASEPDLGPLVAAARDDGDEEAFRLLYREVQPGLLRYLRGMVGGDAEDVASEAWLQIARDLRRFRDEGGGFRAWAVGIARHRALDHLRRTGRRPAVSLPADVLLDLPAGHDTADQAVQAVATRAAIEMIAALPRDQAEAILLRVVVGLDARATARVLGKRPGAVRTAAWRGLRRLAAQLDRTATPTNSTATEQGLRPSRPTLRPSPTGE
ncbi:RNA polymerase subunit sigma-24 [Micromonospora endophytica]|uniref:RNA polymerase subunit sigma-24 n=1 Tax=Micromonospora endophytica TaxID=515350 RepID=A0A2W2CCY9_9ACTN|nr:sigma-70 family RNA polymerase sigma factor [Micromonospora endophytica]PZF86177.1 RNA polymerase subunit sigma-24 [Micromonospora endophytica]RIW50940.1 sigma-70 family RNA polymerase sigma factor [Micromonospora endophytica]